MRLRDQIFGVQRGGDGADGPPLMRKLKGCGGEHMGVNPKIGGKPENGWFIVENPN